jgi:hypothetical protein
LIDPRNGVLRCGQDKVESIVQNYIKDIFSGEFEKIKDNVRVAAPVAGADRVSVTSRNSCHSYAVDPSPKLTAVDNSKSLQSDPAGYCDRDISLEELKAQVRKLKSGKAAGWDLTPNEAITHAGEAFLALLTELYSQIFNTATMPAVWNHGRLVLIHKKDLVEDIYNYRPLCVMAALCGLYSKVLSERLTNTVEEHGLLGEVQNGFRRDRTCTDNRFILGTLLWKAKAKRTNAHCGYVDFEKAYDSVVREKLWAKLQKLGFGAKFIDAVKAMYKDDCTSTKVGGKRTAPVYQRRGLRQGCSLSPILFAIYVADLGQDISLSTLGFKVWDIIISGLFLADDLVLVARTSQGLRQLLEIVRVWCVEHCMRMSVKKTKVISPDDEQWDLFDEQGNVALSLERVDKYKYLGVESFQSMYKAGTAKQGEAIKTAHKYKGSCMRVSYAGPDRMELGLSCWQMMAVPAIRFGCEIIPFSKKTYSELDRTQAQMAKWLLGLPQGAPNICAQTALGLRSVKHLLYEDQLKYYWRVLHMPVTRWAHKALREHLEGDWRSPYLEHIHAIRAEVGMTVLQPSVSLIKRHLDLHFVDVTNKRLLEYQLPAVTKLDRFGLKPAVSEEEDIKWCYMFQYASAPIGNKKPRPGHSRKRDCPLCAAWVKLTEEHLFACGALVAVRSVTLISTFQAVCRYKGIGERECYGKYVRGEDISGTFLGIGELRDRGHALAKLVETFNSLW